MLSRQMVDSPPRGTERILLVEDNPAVRKSTARLLGMLGYQVGVACDGADALSVLAREGEVILDEPGIYQQPLDDVNDDVSGDRVPDAALVAVDAHCNSLSEFAAALPERQPDCQH